MSNKLTLKLIGEDGNAFSILGKAVKELRSAGASDFEIEEFREEATSGDYDHLLRVCMEWFDIE